jgi:hypothetical protein
MTPVFLFSLLATAAIVGSLLIVLIEHIRKHPEDEMVHRVTDNQETESAANADAGFDWKRAA